MMKQTFVVAAVVMTLAAGGFARQAPDRSVAPKPGSAPVLKPPAIEKRKLTNGLPVWIVELHKVPVAHVSLVVKSGSGDDPAQKFGVANLTAQMLDEGAGGRDALAIADAVDYLGAELSAFSSFDATYVDLQVPVARLKDAVPIMADVALRPTFPDKELDRLRQELLTSLIQAQDNPASLVTFAFPRLVYGAEHRYGTSAVGTGTTIKGFTTADLKAFHTEHFVPANSALIVTGDVTPASVLPMLETVFGSWKGGAAPSASVPAAPQLQARQVYLIDKPGAAQSQIRIGWVGVPRSTPDFYTLRLLNTVLGGAFTSRLNTNLREVHGYSYGASSTFDMRLAPGPFYASAGVQTDKTSESLQEFFKELDGIRKPIPAEELEKAKNYVALQLPRNFETTGAIASAISQMVVYGLPDDYYATFTDRLRAVTVADAQRAAEKYIQPDKLAVVIVGDRKAIESKVAALKLGPLKVVSVDEILK